MADAALGVRLLEDLVVEVSGEDARSWLQGQLTCDLVNVDLPAASYGLVLGAKGRIVSDAWVYDAGDAERLWLALPRGAGESTPDRTLERLERYLVMEDVELERSTLRVLSVQRRQESGAAPTCPTGAFPAARLAAGFDRLVPEADAEAAFEAALADGAEALDAEAWRSARIRLHKPSFPDDSADALPQEAGLKGAVSFGKGCYFGQEAVVMLEHRGKPPRRTVALELPRLDAAPPLPVSADGREVGVLTSVAADGDGPVVGLARIKRKTLEAGLPLNVEGTPATLTSILE
ncbi:MAG: hypothetical protein AAF447_24790 [Myxococcota bacterium]